MDIAQKAEKVLKKVKKKADETKSNMITTNQLRNFLSSVNQIKNRVEVWYIKAENEATLPDEIVAEIQYLKVQLVYQIGRDTSYNKAVRFFIDHSGLIEEINNIKEDRKKFMEFSKYVEALVAYHKFYGGR